MKFSLRSTLVIAFVRLSVLCSSVCRDKPVVWLSGRVVAWSFYIRFHFAANYTNPRRPRKPVKRQKQRPLFTPEQLHKLEEEFVNEKYISKSRRCKLAMEISLTEAQVRTWFQNRRTRWRKEVHEEDGDASWTTHSGMDTGVLSGNSMIIRGYCSWYDLQLTWVIHYVLPIIDINSLFAFQTSLTWIQWMIQVSGTDPANLTDYQVQIIVCIVAKYNRITTKVNDHQKHIMISFTRVLRALRSL